MNDFLTRFIHEPSLVAPHMRDHFVSCLSRADSVTAEIAKRGTPDMMKDDYWPDEGSWMSAYRPYKVKDGILSVPVKGALIHDYGYQVDDWVTGYTYIAKAIERGLQDPAVKGIALQINSPGGMVAGCFDLCDKIYRARSEKPVQAFANEHAYSAAYAIASAAGRLSVARTGGVGSIGVVTMHADYSKVLEKNGVKVTFIFAGEHKVDGNPYEPLPEAVKARIQERIDATYGIFVASVARNRRMKEEDVRKTEAATFSAAEALSNGLADAIGALDDGLASFLADLNTNKGGTTMSKDQDKATFDQQAVDAARAEGHTAGVAEGVKTERARVSAIMALDEAKTRRESAFNIALKSDLSVEQAKELLATLPQTEAAQAKQPEAKEKTPFEKAMEQGNPNLGAGAGEAQVSDKDRILADAGIKKRQK